MVSNPGFSFTNINGKYKIVPIEKTDFHDVDPLYSEAIVCDEVGDLVTIYSEDKVVTKDSDSIAFKFAKINISHNNEILDFCSRYGLIMSELNFANFRNDYLFFESKKDEFTKLNSISSQRTRPFNRYKKIHHCNALHIKPYCCNECALRVAKREQRKREKLK